MKKLLSSFSSFSEYTPTLMLIYTMNITDYFFTLIMISSGLINGAGPYPISSGGLLADLIVKCLLPLGLLFLLQWRLANETKNHRKIIKLLLWTLMCYFFVVNVFHIFRLCYLIFLF